MKYLSTPEAAQYIGISPRTLEAMRLSGRGPIYSTAGRLVRYARTEIDRWLRANQRTSTPKDKPAADERSKQQG